MVIVSALPLALFAYVFMVGGFVVVALMLRMCRGVLYSGRWSRAEIRPVLILAAVAACAAIQGGGVAGGLAPGHVSPVMVAAAVCAAATGAGMAAGAQMAPFGCAQSPVSYRTRWQAWAAGTARAGALTPEDGYRIADCAARLQAVAARMVQIADAATFRAFMGPVKVAVVGVAVLAGSAIGAAHVVLGAPAWWYSAGALGGLGMLAGFWTVWSVHHWWARAEIREVRDGIRALEAAAAAVEPYAGPSACGYGRVPLVPAGRC